ncbi:MAG: hypothetical protein ABSF47_03575 [Minisyncoccia bacterium]|jgi:hypothetical protein
MKNKYALMAIAVILLGIFFLLPKKQNEPPVNPLAVYVNEEYGFEIQYPKNITPTSDFGTFYHLPALWRSGALTDENGQSNGKPIISIPVFYAESNDSYPRYFSAQLRIGASADPKDVATCLENDQGYTTEPKSDTTINGVDFKKFEFSDAAMMQYLKVASYRIIHNGVCFAVEQIETGSHYRDDPPSAKDIPDAQLNAYFESINDIVKTFRFTK